MAFAISLIYILSSTRVSGRQQPGSQLAKKHYSHVESPGQQKPKFTAKNISSYTWKKQMNPWNKSHSSVSGQIQASALLRFIWFFQ